jgi:hypothetical protein
MGGTVEVKEFYKMWLYDLWKKTEDRRLITKKTVKVQVFGEARDVERCVQHFSVARYVLST